MLPGQRLHLVGGHWAPDQVTLKLKECMRALQVERDALAATIDCISKETTIAILSHPTLPELDRRMVEQLERILIRR